MPESRIIRLHLLGVLRLEVEGMGAQRSVLAQPRRAALLAYLVLRARHGPARRDTLLGVFWPESDTSHARGALRNALHFLRGSLGAGVIESRGSEEVELDVSRVWCDALEFERLCDEGDLAGALRLYGGDLLPGFFISEAHGFEHWLDAERERLHQRATDAVRRLAARAEAEGELGLAVLRLRDLLELAPTDEAAVRQLMRLLAAADDRGEALHVFSDLRTRLDTEYGLEPAEETRDLADAIRAGSSRTGPFRSGGLAPDNAPDRSTAPQPALPSAGPAAVGRGAEQEPPAVVPPTVPNAAGSRRWSPAALATAAAVLLVMIGATMLRELGSADDLSADAIAVLPFEYRGAADHAYLAEGLADLLAANLNGAGDLRAVDPHALLPRVQSLTQPIEPAVARREAAAHGADHFVLGSITEAGGHLRIAATLYGPGRSGWGRPTVVVEEGAANDLLVLADRLSLALLQRRGATTLVQAALRTTGSVEALKSFLRGEAALRRSDLHGAIDHYRRATLLDSTFALAYYRLSSAAYRQGISRVPAPAAAAALRHAGRLVREDSLLVAAWYHHVRGSVAAAHQHYGEALTLRPSHVEAAFQLGELRFHWGSAIGVPAAEAREPFSRVLAAEPNNAEAAVHLMRIAARQRWLHELDSLAAVVERADAAERWTLEIEALRAFLSRDQARQDRAIGAAARQPSGDRTILEYMAAFSYNLAAVERIARARLQSERSPVEQARMQLFLVHVQLGRGRYRDAARSIETADALPAARRLEYLAMLASLPFAPLPPGAVAAVRDRITAHPDLPLGEEGGPIAGSGVEYPHLLWPGLYRPQRLYLMGALHVRLGDFTAADAAADSLAAERPHDARALGYELLTRARAAAAADLPAAALRSLGSARAPPNPTFESLVDHDRPYERWLRAELLRETDRIAEALRWYGTFPDPMARDLAYLAPSHLRRAELHDAAGDREQAALHYQRFVELWAAADPELQPEVSRAETRLRELTSRRR